MKNYLLAGIGVAAVLLVYGFNNPYEVSFFPSCPFFSLTGFECAGCGSQRALHYLAVFRPDLAFRENPLLVSSLPYVMVGFYFDNRKELTAAQKIWRKRLFGQTAIVIITAIIIAWWIFRNVW